MQLEAALLGRRNVEGRRQAGDDAALELEQRDDEVRSLEPERPAVTVHAVALDDRRVRVHLVGRGLVVKIVDERHRHFLGHFHHDLPAIPVPLYCYNDTHLGPQSR